MIDDVLVEEGPFGPIMRPTGPSDITVLYIPDDTAAKSYAPFEWTRQVAATCGAEVIRVRYRRTFPDALDDVRAAYLHYCDVNDVVVVGERLGAGLVAALMVELRDSAGTLPRCAILLSALVDLTMDARSLVLGMGIEGALDVSELRRRVSEYADGASVTNPLISPLYANLHGLPPLQLLISGTDPLLDDSLAFAARAARSGVSVDLRVCRDVRTLDTELPYTAASFIRRCLRPQTHCSTSAAVGLERDFNERSSWPGAL